jgi:hypothetical protein
MGKVMETNSKIFNTPLEIGMRILIIMNHSKHSGIKNDIERLMYLDYLCLNTHDIGGEESIHAPIPNRGLQIYARQELIRKGLVLLISKEFVVPKSNKFGFYYEINEVGSKFLEYFESDYYIALSNRVKWTVEKFNSTNNKILNRFIKENLHKWGGELLEEK